MIDSPGAGLVVFVDRDGTINERASGGGYVTRVEEFHFLPGAREGLRLLAEAGATVFVATNQRCVARGLLTEAGLSEIHRMMLDGLAEAGARVEAVYHCPHETGTCDCRKPGTGMFRAALRDFPWISGRDTYVIGDSDCDVEAAARLSWPSVRVNGDVRSLLDAARLILAARSKL
jgi:histidinol-phosphate phosphatase family protein